MGVPHPARQPEWSHLPPLLTLHSKTTVPRLSMMTILNGGVHLRGSLGRMKPIIWSARRPAIFWQLIACIARSHLFLYPVSSPLLVLFISLSLLQVLGSTRKKLDLASKQPAPKDARRATSALVSYMAEWLIAL